MFLLLELLYGNLILRDVGTASAKEKIFGERSETIGCQVHYRKFPSLCQAFVTPFRFQSPPAAVVTTLPTLVEKPREKVFNQDPKSEREIVCLFVYNMVQLEFQSAAE